MAAVIDMEMFYMLARIHFSFFITTEISFIVGVMIHVYIIAVNVIEWRRGRAMSTSDQVIISIMISRMILQPIMQINMFFEIFCMTAAYIMCTPMFDLVFRVIYFSTMYCSYWLSSLLCVVFYLKISNSHGVFFLWMKKIFSNRILHFIIASVLVSIAQTSVTYIVFYFAFTTFVVMNTTLLAPPTHAMSGLFIGNMVGPLLIFLLSSLLLITSLYLHIRHMRCNRTVTGSLDPYYRIIKYTAGSIITSVLCILITVLGEKYYYMFTFLSFSFPWTFFGTLHSMLLIYVTPKLKTPLSKIFKYLSSCWRKREETRDLVMTVTT